MAHFDFGLGSADQNKKQLGKREKGRREKRKDEREGLSAAFASSNLFFFFSSKR